MARRNIARSLLVALALGVSLPVLGACVVTTRTAVVVDTPPPPPRRAHVEVRPGFVWVEGTWAYRGDQWVWSDGYWERERPGQVYVQGRWTKRAGRWHWVEPRWDRGHVRGHMVRDEAGRRPVPAVRDHRSGPEPAARDRRSPPREPAVQDRRRPDDKKKDTDRERVEVRDHR
jgi:hypothetical protein